MIPKISPNPFDSQSATGSSDRLSSLPETASVPVVSVFQATKFPVKGGCHRGAMRYKLHGPAKSVAHCHRSICRKTHGALVAAYALVGRKHLTLDKGADDLTTYESSPRVRREFCRICGSSLSSRSRKRPLIAAIILLPLILLGCAAHTSHTSHTSLGIPIVSDCGFLPTIEGSVAFNFIDADRRECLRLQTVLVSLGE